MKLFYFLITGVVFCLLSNSASAQSQGLYLKADELTKDAGSNQTYKDYAQLNSFQFGAEHPVSRIDRRFKGDTPSFREITFTQASNLSSNPFRSYLMNAINIDNMELISLQAVNVSTVGIAYKVELKDVMITSATILLNDEGAPLDSFTATFTAVKITTYSYNSKNGYTANPPFMFNQDSQSADF
jgi:type VI protein secretion system component Hcp